MPYDNQRKPDPREEEAEESKKTGVTQEPVRVVRKTDPKNIQLVGRGPTGTN